MTPGWWTHWGPVVVAVIGGLICGGGGGALTRIDGWYRGLRKPSWQPPDWLFGPVWTTIIALAVWSAVIGWRHAGSMTMAIVVAVLFALNVALNVGWSYLFFFVRRPDRALREVAGLWLSIVALIVALAPISALAAPGVLVPEYDLRLWVRVSFASAGLH